MPRRPHKQVQFTGFLPARLVDVIDRTKEPEFSKYDVFLNLIFRTEGSDYDRTMALIGNFEFDKNKEIVDNSFLRKLYRVIDGFGEQGGVDVSGKWVDVNDNSVDIEKHLKEKYITTTENYYPYLVYVYKVKGKDGKVYSRVYPMVVPNTVKGRESLENHVNYMLNRGFLVPYIEGSEEIVVTSKDELEPYDGQF